MAHTWHLHRRRKSTGHVWQGRFKSPVIEDDEHLLTVMRYGESNPLRAGMVSDLAVWPWSSFASHVGLATDDLVSVAPVWSRLGEDEAKRQEYWRRWLHEPLTAKELAAVRNAVTSGRPFGSETWIATTAERLGLKLASRQRGRPRKQAEK